MKIKDVLLVEWRDIFTMSPWQHSDPDYVVPCPTCYSVGFKMKSDSKTLVISGMVSDDDVAATISIPRGAITKITKLGSKE